MFLAGFAAQLFFSKCLEGGASHGRFPQALGSPQASCSTDEDSRCFKLAEVEARQGIWHVLGLTSQKMSREIQCLAEQEICSLQTFQNIFTRCKKVWGQGKFILK